MTTQERDAGAPRTWQSIIHAHWRREMTERLAIFQTQAHPAVYRQVVADLATCTPGDVVWEAIDRFVAHRIGVDPRFPLLDPPRHQAEGDYLHALLWDAIERQMEQEPLC